MNDLNPVSNSNLPPAASHRGLLYVFGICVGVVIVACAGLFLMWFRQHVTPPAQVPMTVNGISIPTKALIPNTVFSTSTSQVLASLYNQLQQATSTSRQAALRFQIANVSFSADPSAGYPQLESIAADVSYPAVQRALATQFIGDIYFNRSGQSTIALHFIFAAPPFTAMLDSTPEPKDKKLWNGMKNVYLHALSFANSPISNYRVALWYLNDAESTTTSSSQAAADLTQAQSYLGKGNIVLNRFEATLSPSNIFMQADAYWLQATVTGTLGIQTKNQTLVQNAAALFANTRTLLLKQLAPTAGISLSTRDELNVELLWSDFNNAALISQQPNTAGNTALTNELLSEIVRINNPRYGFSRWLVLLQTTTPTVQTMIDAKKEIAAFASLNPSFAAMLTQLTQSPSGQ